MKQEIRERMRNDLHKQQNSNIAAHSGVRANLERAQQSEQMQQLMNKHFCNPCGISFKNIIYLNVSDTNLVYVLTFMFNDSVITKSTMAVKIRPRLTVHMTQTRPKHNHFSRVPQNRTILTSCYSSFYQS